MYMIPVSGIYYLICLLLQSNLEKEAHATIFAKKNLLIAMQENIVRFKFLEKLKISFMLQKMVSE